MIFKYEFRSNRIADFIELVKFDKICSLKFFKDGVRGRDFFLKKVSSPNKPY